MHNRCKSKGGGYAYINFVVAKRVSKKIKVRNIKNHTNVDVRIGCNARI